MGGRRPLAIGEVGNPTYKQSNGVVYARAYTRDAGGTRRRLRASAPTEAEAYVELVEQARALAIDVESIGLDTPLSVAFERWVTDREPEVRYQSIRIYRATLVWLKPLCGAIPISECKPKRVKAIIDAVRKTRGDAAVHHARVALNGAFKIAVEDGALDYNPMLSLRRVKQKRDLPKALTPNQVSALREAALDREERVRRYVGDSAPLLRWVMEVQLGSGLRISEVTALRNMDVDLDTGRIDVNGTMIDDDQWHLVRQDELKGRGQSRFIDLPKFAVDALREAKRNQTTFASRLPQAPAIQGRVTEAFVSSRALRKSLRALRNEDVVVRALAETGLEPDDLVPHTLRRTAATLVAMHTGDLRDAKSLLGHSSEQTTKAHYAGRAFRVVGSAAILDSIIGRSQG